ncbi:MAG: hypothetical protein ABS52_11130 [Gemmatimonadetes bacterium SCN 70-22]|nr:MAG: hypothetical protein ABS52_11130 [Gemmatimonadetes bacterium SCN 70-22]
MVAMMLLMVMGVACAEPAVEGASVAIGAAAHARTEAVAPATQRHPAGTVAVNRVSREAVPARVPNPPGPAPASSHAPCSCTHAVALTCPPTLALCVVGTTTTRPVGVDGIIPPSPTLERELRPPVAVAG